MKKQERATIKMCKTLCVGMFLDEKTYQCEVLQYDKNAEILYLVLTDELLTHISLDAFYECVVEGDDPIRCVCVVQERYFEGTNAILKLQIKNGFYKINIK